MTVVRLRDDPFHAMLPAGGAVLNGAGECTGFITAGEWGTLETPVFLTSTLQLGRVYDAACELMLERWPDVAEDFIIPVVGECDDSFLNDARRMQVSRARREGGLGRRRMRRSARQRHPPRARSGREPG